MDVANLADRLLDGDLAGTYREASTGAVLTLPWPRDPRLLPPSLAPYAVHWAAENLVHHLTGEPWRYTPGQLRWLHLWYAIDAQGRWIYRRGIRRGSKGTGKDPLAASHSNVELLAPVRFAGWARPPAPGRPGIPLAETVGLPLVQIAANTEGQAKDVLRVAKAMLPMRTREEYGVDAGTTRIAVAGGGLLELLTNSTENAEGDPASHITLNESHHMTKSNGGHELAAVCRRNVGKSPGGLARVCEYTNAHQPGRDSVAERAFHAWQDQIAGKTPKRDILYDSREAEPGIKLEDVDAVRRGLRQAYADAPWVDLERVLDEVYDPETSAADARRFYLNNNTAAEDALVDPGQYDACAGRTHELGARLAKGDPVVLFGDGSKSDDATGILICRLSDGLVDVGHVQQPGRDVDGRPILADREWIDGDVADLFAVYDVRAFHFDPSVVKDNNAAGEDDRYWWPLVDEWHRRYGPRLKHWAAPRKHAIAYDLRNPERQAEWCGDVKQLVEDVEELRLLTSRSAVLRTHMHNARRRPGRYGLGMGKVNRESAHKIDLAVCAAGARGLRRRYLLAQASARPKPQAGRARAAGAGAPRPPTPTPSRGGPTMPGPLLIEPDPISRLRWARQHARPHWLRDGRLVRYAQGRQGVPYTPAAATAEYRQLQRRCITNVVKLACETLTAGLRVNGLTPSDLALEPADSSATDGPLAIPDSAAADALEQTIAQAEGWRYWQAAKLDAGQTLATYRATVLGYCHVVTWVTDEVDGDGDDDGDPGTRLLADPLYEARSVNPLASWGYYDDVDDVHPDVFIRRLGGLSGISNGNGRWEVWSSDEAGGYRAIVDERSNSVVKLWRHDLDHVPVTRLVGARDVEGYPEGRVDPLRPAQDRVNEAVFALLMGQTYQAHRQRWAVGVKLDDGSLKPGVDRVWWTEATKDAAQFGEFQAADLNNLVAGVNSALGSFASLAQLPPQNVLGLPSNVSADGLAAAEAAHTRLRDSWKANLGEGWEEVVRDLGRLAGDDDVAEDTASQCTWAAVESRSFTQVADGLQKLTAGDRPILPVEVAIELVPGLTQQDRNRALRILKNTPPAGLAAIAGQAAGALLPGLPAMPPMSSSTQPPAGGTHL